MLADVDQTLSGDRWALCHGLHVWLLDFTDIVAWLSISQLWAFVADAAPPHLVRTGNCHSRLYGIEGALLEDNVVSRCTSGRSKRRLLLTWAKITD